MNNNKQTAVEWLINIVVQDQLERDVPMVRWIEIFEQAKAIHKQEIIDAANYQYYLNGEQYYEQTFGGNNEQQ